MALSKTPKQKKKEKLLLPKRKLREAVQLHKKSHLRKGVGSHRQMDRRLEELCTRHSCPQNWVLPMNLMNYLMHHGWDTSLLCRRTGLNTSKMTVNLCFPVPTFSLFSLVNSQCVRRTHTHTFLCPRCPPFVRLFIT